MTIPIIGSFTGTGRSAPFRPTIRSMAWGSFNIFLSGTAVASVQLERSFDGGTTWCEITAAGVPLYQWSYSGTNISEGAEEPELGVVYSLNCTSYTSGTLDYRLSQ